MTHEYHPLATISYCTHCGASDQNNYTHQPSCLINIPGPHQACASFWYRGRNHGDRPSGMTPAQEQSYEMGKKMSKVPFPVAA